MNFWEKSWLKVIVSTLAVSFVFLTYINGMHIVGKPSIVLFFNKVVPNNFLYEI